MVERTVDASPRWPLVVVATPVRIECSAVFHLLRHGMLVFVVFSRHLPHMLLLAIWMPSLQVPPKQHVEWDSATITGQLDVVTPVVRTLHQRACACAGTCIHNVDASAVCMCMCVRLPGTL